MPVSFPGEGIGLFKHCKVPIRWPEEVIASKHDFPPHSGIFGGMHMVCMPRRPGILRAAACCFGVVPFFHDFGNGAVMPSTEDLHHAHVFC